MELHGWFIEITHKEVLVHFLADSIRKKKKEERKKEKNSA